MVNVWYRNFKLFVFLTFDLIDLCLTFESWHYWSTTEFVVVTFDGIKYTYRSLKLYFK